MNSKYNTFLTVLLVIVIIAIVGIIAFLGYKYVSSMNSKKEAEDFTDTWNNSNINQEPKKDDNNDEKIDITEPDNTNTGNNSTEQTPKE